MKKYKLYGTLQAGVYLLVEFAQIKSCTFTYATETGRKIRRKTPVRAYTYYDCSTHFSLVEGEDIFECVDVSIIEKAIDTLKPISIIYKSDGFLYSSQAHKHYKKFNCLGGPPYFIRHFLEVTV